MDNLLIILLAMVIIGCLGKSKHSSGGIVVKDNPASQRPKVGAAPQGIKLKKQKRNKQGRSKDEQELHEWMEDNPR